MAALRIVTVLSILGVLAGWPAYPEAALSAQGQQSPPGGYLVGRSGAKNPRVIREVKPSYTPDAMRAKIEGSVVVECVVQPDGTVGDVRVIKSLDSVYGLDAEAVKAAKQWRFLPGRPRNCGSSWTASRAVSPTRGAQPE